MSDTDNPNSEPKEVAVDEAPPVAPYVMETHSYYDEQGRAVEENRLIAGTRPEDQPEFVGQGKLKATAPPPVGQVEALFGFTIKDAESVEDAFTKFDAALEEARPQYLQEFTDMVKSQVTAAREMTSKIAIAQEMDLKDLQVPGANGTGRGSRMGPGLRP